MGAKLGHLLTLAVLALACVHAALAEGSAHVHGSATLGVVVDGPQLVIELDSPAANLIGFEHRPSDATEEAAVQAALARLQRPEQMFTIPPSAGCESTAVEIDYGLDTAAGQAEHDAGEAREGATPTSSPRPDEGTSHEGPDEREHEHEHAQHTDIVATYQYRCAATTAIEALAIGLFDAFPLLERLDVQFVNGAMQGAEQLTRDRPVLAF